MKFLYVKKISLILIIIFLLSMLTACTTGQSTDIMSDDAVLRAINTGILRKVEAGSGDTSASNLVQVRYGDILQTVTLRINFDTSMIRELYFETGEVRLLEKRASLNQVVSKGDILAVAQTDTAVILTEIEIMERTIERFETSFERDRRQHQRVLGELRAELEEMTDELQREIQTLQIRKYNFIYNNFIKQHENTLIEYNKQLDELYERLEGDKIIAPFDGVIVVERTPAIGQIMQENEVLYGMIDLSMLRFIASASVDLVRFGDIIPAVLHGLDARFDFIVASDPLSTNTRQDSYNFLFQPVDRQGFWNTIAEQGTQYSDYRNLRLDALIIRHELNNVLIIPKTALHQLDDEVYVLLYEDNEPKIRFVDVGFSDQNNVQILAGLSEGQYIIR